MSRTDLLGDTFTIIRNAAQQKKEEAIIPWAKILLKVCDILKKEGYFEDYKEVTLENFKKIKVYLKYEGKKSIFSEIKRISKPGRRIYAKCSRIKPVLRGYGIALISTSRGILTDKEAREKGLGGEVLGQIW